MISWHDPLGDLGRMGTVAGLRSGTSPLEISEAISSPGRQLAAITFQHPNISHLSFCIWPQRRYYSTYIRQGSSRP